MRQAGLKNLFRGLEGERAKARGWKVSQGFCFKTSGLLFFVLVIIPDSKTKSIHYGLRYKLFEFDDLFWKIMNMETNAKEPLSLRARGAFTAPTSGVAEGSFAVSALDERSLGKAIDTIFDVADPKVAELSTRIRSPIENLEVVEIIQAEILMKSPRAVTRTDVQQVLTSIIRNDFDGCRTIIRERIAAKDSGGFSTGRKTFFQMADEYLRRIGK